jgi:hypothetical protein
LRESELRLLARFVCRTLATRQRSEGLTDGKRFCNTPLNLSCEATSNTSCHSAHASTSVQSLQHIITTPTLRRRSSPRLSCCRSASSNFHPLYYQRHWDDSIEELSLSPIHNSHLVLHNRITHFPERASPRMRPQHKNGQKQSRYPVTYDFTTHRPNPERHEPVLDTFGSTAVTNFFFLFKRCFACLASAFFGPADCTITHLGKRLSYPITLIWIYIFYVYYISYVASDGVWSV